jgi:hypothetical protein
MYQHGFSPRELLGSASQWEKEVRKSYYVLFPVLSVTVRVFQGEYLGASRTERMEALASARAAAFFSIAVMQVSHSLGSFRQDSAILLSLYSCSYSEHFLGKHDTVQSFVSDAQATQPDRSRSWLPLITRCSILLSCSPSAVLVLSCGFRVFRISFEPLESVSTRS